MSEEQLRAFLNRLREARIAELIYDLVIEFPDLVKK